MEIIKSLINTLAKGGMESFGRYYSKYRGFVSDNEDPENLGRLKLIIPQVTGNQVYDYWAFPSGVYSGVGYGSQCLPSKGDVVWIEFEGGRPELPIWQHGHLALKEFPTGDDDLKDVKCYWFKTPEGNIVKLYDTKKLIHIENPSGNYLELNENGFSAVSDKSISLGTLDVSEYKAVLGEKNKAVLEDIEKILSTLHQAMTADIAVYTSKGFTNMVTAIPQVLVEVNGLKAKIELILSNKVTLD